jgi:tubulin polyglutamylase TTLL9
LSSSSSSSSCNVSFSPLQCWLHRSGFSRFSHSRYSSDPRDISNNFLHLTNVAIQKTAENYDAVSGGKWDVKSLKMYMVSQFGREMVDETFWRIQMLVLRSLFAVQQVLSEKKGLRDVCQNRINISFPA